MNIDSLYLNSARPYRRADIFNAGIGRDNEKRNGEIGRIGCGLPAEREKRDGTGFGSGRDVTGGATDTESERERENQRAADWRKLGHRREMQPGAEWNL